MKWKRIPYSVSQPPCEVHELYDNNGSLLGWVYLREGVWAVCPISTITLQPAQPTLADAKRALIAHCVAERLNNN